MKTKNLALTFALALLTPACAVDSHAPSDEGAGADEAYDGAESSELATPDQGLATEVHSGREQSGRGSVLQFETPGYDTGSGVTLGQWTSLDGPTAKPAPHDDTGAGMPSPGHSGPRPDTPSDELEARHDARVEALHLAFACDTTTTGRVVGDGDAIFVGWKDGCTSTPLGVEITHTAEGWTVRDEAYYGATVSIERSEPGSEWGFLELETNGPHERLVLTAIVRFHTTRDVVVSSAIEAIASHEID